MAPSKSKKNGGCFTFFILTLLATGAGYYYGKNFLLGSELTLESSSQVIPQSALANTFISTNQEQWAKLEEFSTPFTQEMIDKNWKKLVNDNLGQQNQNIDYQQDILPWLGGISFAVLPSSESEINYDIVTILGIKNKLKANSFLQKIKQNNTEKPIETKYQNITIYQIDNNNNQIWVSVFNNYLVIAEEEKIIQKIIDTYKGGESLADVSSQNLPSQNGILQVYLPDYNNWFLNIIKDTLPEINIENSAQAQLGKIDSITMNLSVENHGLKLSSLVNLSQPVTFNPNIKPVSNNLLTKIPDNTICLVSGGGVNQIWQELNKEKQNIPELDLFISQAKIVTLQWLNLDLDKDIFSWLDGEFALALLSPNNNQFSQGLNGLLLLESSNKTQGEATFKNIENAARLFPFIQINQNNIDGISITEWSSPQEKLLSYGWVNNNNFLLTFSSNFQDIKNMEKSNSLSENNVFKIATESLPKTNYGYFYCNLEKAFSLAENLDDNLWDSSTLEFKAFANSITAIAITNSPVNNSTNQVDLNISLSKNK
ncbi:DUF3352 domain-containing protein [Geminocystis sp. NIES-3709]|uniref:DUF3352 domain-containing protein n=1 Tax=Geminocystis sp. NIES-3709 TaxID=1617448 RepID=UPI0005FC628A|nr:DUF3352 domain-containing protein [Geminocystis sp. NIES-3709]BAQ63670.1 hypothetical protein GM3709_435 [Geminocystis sp. NIES-3709]